MLVAGHGVITQAARGAIALRGHARKDVVRVVTLQDSRHAVTDEQHQIEKRLEDADRGLDAAPPSHPALGRGGHRGVSVRALGVRPLGDWLRLERAVSRGGYH
jgi:hypothetical protein